MLFLSTAGAKLRARAAVLIILVIGALTRAKLLIMRGASTPKRGKSTSDNRKPARSPLRADELATLTAGYRRWLARQPLSVNTRRTYLGRVRQYCAYLAAGIDRPFDTPPETPPDQLELFDLDSISQPT